MIALHILFVNFYRSVGLHVCGRIANQALVRVCMWLHSGLYTWGS